MLVLLRGRFARTAFKMINQITVQQVVLVFGIHFITSWFGILLFEHDAEYAQPDTYWWFYIVTITTVGYGDFSPGELGSRLVVALYVMPVGIAIAGAVIGKIAAVVVEISDKMQKGRMALHIENHTIVVGDNSPHTISLLRNLVVDEKAGQVVLVSKTESNPMSDELAGFVSGTVSDKEVLKRACFATAARVIVLGETDVVVTGRTVKVVHCTNDEAEIIAYFQHEDAEESLYGITPDRVRTVSSVSMDLVVQEALDPGAAGFVSRLTKNQSDASYLCLVVPDDVIGSYTDIDTFLLESEKVNVISYYEGTEVLMIPDATMPAAGLTLAVIAHGRAQLDAIDWSTLQNAS